MLTIGSTLVAVSLVGFALLGDGTSYFAAVLVPLVVHAAGIAFVFAPGTVAIMHRVPEGQAASGSGLLQMDQQIGGALGIAVVTSIYAFDVIPGTFVSSLPAAFIGAAVIALIAAIIAWRAVGLPVSPRPAARKV
jgi:hypothetical protein